MKHMTKIVTSLIAPVLLSGLLLSSAAAQEDTESVTLCHATASDENNPFVEITVDAEGAFNGHLGTGQGTHQDAEDIIPPFFYDGTEYSQNWDAEGQAILENSCNIPDIEPTEVPTEEPTVVPTEEPTVVPTEVPTEEPTVVPTTPGEPTAVPTEPTVVPTTTTQPTAVPTDPVNELPVTGSGLQDNAGYLMLAGGLLAMAAVLGTISVKFGSKRR